MLRANQSTEGFLGQPRQEMNVSKACYQGPLPPKPQCLASLIRWQKIGSAYLDVARQETLSEGS